MPFGSTTLINVTGASVANGSMYEIRYFDWNAGQFVQLNDPESRAGLEDLRRGTLWNFPEATTLALPPYMAWQGSILAPRAVVTVTGGNINGALMAGAVSGNTGETHTHPPDVVPAAAGSRARPCPRIRRRRRPRRRPPRRRRRRRPRPDRDADGRRPRTTPTPTPTRTPVPTRTPTPVPTPEPPGPTPQPIVSPTATPDTHEPSEPLEPEETPGTVVVEGARERRPRLQEGHDAARPCASSG